MFKNTSQKQPIDNKQQLKDIVIKIKLLQRTCEMIDSPHMRPRQYQNLSYDEAVRRQKSFFPKMRELAATLSVSELRNISKEATEEAQILMETTSGEPSFYFK